MAEYVQINWTDKTLTEIVNTGPADAITAYVAGLVAGMELHASGDEVSVHQVNVSPIVELYHTPATAPAATPGDTPVPPPLPYQPGDPAPARDYEPYTTNRIDEKADA